MEKFIKSIFSSSVPEKKRIATQEHSDDHKKEGESEHNPVGDRRKLSMSRSGRLKHNNKIRHQLSMELYGGEDHLQQPEKPKSKEYHVNAPTEKSENGRKKSVDATTHYQRKSVDATVLAQNGGKSPEEEIDSAFEIIDKS